MNIVFNLDFLMLSLHQLCMIISHVILHLVHLVVCICAIRISLCQLPFNRSTISLSLHFTCILSPIRLEISNSLIMIIVKSIRQSIFFAIYFYWYLHFHLSPERCHQATIQNYHSEIYTIFLGLIFTNIQRKPQNCELSIQVFLLGTGYT